MGMETMDVYARKGSKVIVTEKSIKNGYALDSHEAIKLFKVGDVYTVEKTFIQSFSSTVEL